MTAPSWSTPPDRGGSASWGNDQGHDDERPLGELLSDMGKSLQVLLSKEVELAKAELSEQASRAGKASAMLGVGAVTGFLAVLLVSFAAAWGLAEAIAPGLAFLTIGLLYAVTAVLLIVTGKSRMQRVQPVPRQTVQTLREDVEVAKTSFSRGAQT
jgi:uncharacterized membrane protein YqjE